MQTPLCKIGPGGDFTRDTLMTGPTVAPLPLANLHAKVRRQTRALVCELGLIAAVSLAVGASLVVSWPPTAWLGIGLLIAGAYIVVHPGR